MPADPTLSARYQSIRQLPDVPGVICWLVRDVEDGSRLVIRDVPSDVFKADLRTRFENEVRLLGQLDSEYYNPLVSYDVRGEHLRLVYRYVDGYPLSRIISSTSMSAKLVLELACDLLQALTEIHELGCVHRDFRPSHIIMRPTGAAVLAGYGPVWHTNLSAGDHPISIETVRYTSPELAGIIRHDIGPASDLYSVGLVLFSALAGQPMYRGQAVGEILLQQSTIEIDTGRLPRDTPPLLISLIEHLTKKEPRERYQSSAAALADAQAIHEAIENDKDTSRLVIGRSDCRTYLTDPAFVGREEQLQSLTTNLTEAIEGGLPQVLLLGRSGMGNSRLIQEACRHATRHGMLVLKGDCIARANPTPNAPWLQVIDQIAQYCHGNRQERKRLHDDMVDFREEVITAMPALAKEFDWKGRGLAGPEELGQGRIVSAFGHLLSRLGSAETPFFLSLENSQWMDDQSIRVLKQVAQSSGSHQMLLVSSRPDEGQSESIREAAHYTDQLRLGPLDEGSVRRLCESMAGRLPEDAIELVQTYSDGSPFMADAILRGMSESGVLHSQKGRWVVDHEKLQNFQTAKNAGEILASRLQGLPAKARRFLNAAAVIGSEFTLDTVVQLAQIDLSEAHTMLADIRKQRLVWSKPDGTLAFVHDNVRNAVLKQLSPELRKRMHGQIGRYLVETRPDESYELAYHFDAAGMHHEALPHALNAAAIARDNFSLGAARSQLQIAARAFHVAQRATRHRIESMMSEVLMLQGEYDEAEKWLKWSAASAVTERDEAVVAMRRGELAFKRGNKDRAVQYYESALSRLGQPVCQGSIRSFVALLSEIVKQTAHTLVPALRGRRTTPPDESEKLRLKLYSLLAHAYWYTRDKQVVLWAHLRGLNLGELYRPTSLLAQSYSEHAPAMSLLGWSRRGIRYAKQSLQIRRELNDVWGQGQSRSFLSILLYSSSRFEECVTEARQAVSILERTGDFWEVHIARYQLAAALYRQGELREAIEQARANYRSAVRCSDYQGTGNIVAVWARASMGHIPYDVLETELARDVYDAQRISQVKLAHGVYLFYQHRYSEAATEFSEAIDNAVSASVVNTYISPSYAWLASALRRQLETDPPKTKSARKAMQVRLHRAAKTALAIAKRFSNELPHALREYAASCAMLGDSRAAQRYFERALRVASQQGAKLAHINTVLLHASFAKEAGWPVDDTVVQDAKDEFERLRMSVGSVGETGSLSLINRFESLLDSGRRIATSTSYEKICEEVLGAAATLLRGDRVLIAKAADGAEVTETIPEKNPFDQAIIQQAEHAGTAIVREIETIENENSDYSGDVQSESYGTFLCCPIFVRSEITAYLYVANSRMVGMFGDDELRIANYLASAAGAAFEKAEGFEQLQELNLTLEGKVRDRTDELQRHSDELERTADRLRATQVNLRKAKNDAEDASRAKSEFLARMSHEIRTPITAVLGYTELMLRGIVSDPDEQMRHLETIHGNGSHLLNLLNDILDLSKIEADRIEVEQISCVPAKVVSDVIRSLYAKAEQKGIYLKLDSESGIPETITSDPTRLRQIITNLVGNAIKFTGQGGITIRLSTRTSEETGLPDRILIAIEDTGIGLKPEQTDKIFDPFSQADTSITRRYGGTGLGLAISKRLAESLGGGLEVSSVAGQGSTFTVSIAADTRADSRLLSSEEVIALARGHHQAEWRRVDLSGISVLVVDDAETNRDLITRLLTDSGAEVAAVENGREAIEYLADGDGFVDHGIDVVLMDMQMPILDGYSTTKRLCDHGFEIPIVAMTANSMVGDDAKCRKVGCSDYLSKPIDLDALLEMVRSWSAKKAAPYRQPRKPQPLFDQFSKEEHDMDSSESQQPKSQLPDNWLRKFAVEFVGKVDDKLPLVKRALHNADFEEVARQLHWIKGSGGTVGLAELSARAKTCEAAARSLDVKEMTKGIENIESLISELLDECGDELPKSGIPSVS